MKVLLGCANYYAGYYGGPIRIFFIGEDPRLLGNGSFCRKMLEERSVTKHSRLVRDVRGKPADPSRDVLSLDVGRDGFRGGLGEGVDPLPFNPTRVIRWSLDLSYIFISCSVLISSNLSISMQCIDPLRHECR
jgi:hypothetical protein